MLKFSINTFKWAKLSLHPNLGQLVVLLPCLVCLSHLVPLSCSSLIPFVISSTYDGVHMPKRLVFCGSCFAFVFSYVLELGMAKLKCSKTCVQAFALNTSSWTCVHELMPGSLHFNSSVQILHWHLQVNLDPNLGHIVVLFPYFGHLIPMSWSSCSSISFFIYKVVKLGAQS